MSGWKLPRKTVDDGSKQSILDSVGGSNIHTRMHQNMRGCLLGSPEILSEDNSNALLVTSPTFHQNNQHIEMIP